MPETNWANRTIWTGDNLPIMRGMNSESVDLIYLDPPFNSNANYAAPIGSEAAGAEFKDTWTLADVDVAWLDLIEAKHPKLHRVIHAALTDSDKSYLIYMGIRLLEMHRILKDTGSIYLHCDPTMSHYLKLVMDAVLGRSAFRSDIVWRRINSTGRGLKRFANNTDSILYYTKSGNFVWNQPYRPHDPSYVNKHYRFKDENGRRYRLGDLKGAGTRQGSSGMPWRAVDPTDTGSHWAIPNRELPDSAKNLSSQEKLDILDEMGRIYWPPKGHIPSYKRFLDEMPGTPVDTIWDDIGGIQSQSRERTGYPTQKPLGLLERIIEASSNPDDVVLDPFCGCATTLVAADRLERQWVGIDISELAVKLVRERIEKDQGMFPDLVPRTDVPQRNDLGDLPKYNSINIKNALYGEQGGDCNGCGTHFKKQHLTVDHIIARTKGGTDHIENLQLLCGNCNSVKGDRGMEYLLTKLGA